MLNEFAKEWVDALRSGEYRQGCDTLAQQDAEGPTYCCLGVACDLALKRGIIDEFRPNDGSPPPEVQHALGLSSPDGGYHAHGAAPLPAGYTSRRLIDDNDTHGLTFTEIATIIESEPEGLFSC